MQIQGILAKDFSHFEKSKTKDQKSAPLYTNAVEPLEQNKKDKKDQKNRKRKFQERKEQNDILVTKDNTIDVSKKKKKNQNCDTSRVIYYNCVKKSYFTNTCIKPKKLVLVLATSVPVISSGDEVVRVLYIYYLVQFQIDQRQKSQKQVKGLLNSGNKVNVMSPGYTKKLGFKVQETNIGAQKIDDSILETFEMVIVDFQMKDKVSRHRFF